MTPSLAAAGRLRGVHAFFAGTFGAALVAFSVQSAAWPVHLGRDGTTYLMYYLDFWSAEPAYPQLMLFRTPVAPLFFGPLLQLGGPLLVEATLGVAYALSVASYALAAKLAAGRLAGLAAAVVLVLYPPYGALFHEVSSDSVFAFGLALWTPLLVRTLRAPSARGFALHGVAVALLVLTRPVGLFLAVLVLAPFVLALPLRRRLTLAAAFAATLAVALVGWSAHNALRYGDFTVSRTSGAHYPLYRLFVADRVVSPDNGPASRELAAAVRRDVLTREPYVSYGIDSEEFFSSGSSRMWEDLVALSDRVWGWDSDYAKLRAVAFEAIARHWRLYAWSVGATLKAELTLPYVVEPTRRDVAASTPPGSVVVGGRRLPEPTEGEPIPGAAVWWLASTPDGRVDEPARAELARRTGELERELPPRDGIDDVAGALNAIARAHPPILAWIALGLAAVAAARPAAWRVLIPLVVLPISVVVGAALGEPPVLEYRVPFDPLFMTFAVAASVAAGAELRRRARSRNRPDRQPERQPRAIEGAEERDEAVVDGERRLGDVRPLEDA